MTVVITDKKSIIAPLIHVKKNEEKTIITGYAHLRQNGGVKRMNVEDSSVKGACFII